MVVMIVKRMVKNVARMVRIVSMMVNLVRIVSMMVGINRMVRKVRIVMVIIILRTSWG